MKRNHWFIVICLQTPLDIALLNDKTEILHMLVAVGAPLGEKNQEELESYLRDHPEPEDEGGLEAGEREEETWSWIPAFVLERMQGSSLQGISTEDIKRLLHEGNLPCGWTRNPTWENMIYLIEEKRARTEYHQEKQERLNEKERRLTFQLQSVQSKLQKVRDRQMQLVQDMQIHARQLSTVNLDELSAFVRRVVPIENAEMRALETELRKTEPKLSALTDLQSSQPKLSLFLNCMGNPSETIHATRDLDSAMFQTLTKNPSELFERHRSPQVSEEMLKDLLYCGEILRDCHPPWANHAKRCAVCANRTAEELVHYLQEIGTTLDSETITKNQINGRRVLFTMANEFPNPEAATQALDRIRDIHKNAM